MSCRSAFRSAMLIESYRPIHLTRSSVSASFQTRKPGFFSPLLTRPSRRTTVFHSSRNENQPPLSDDEQGPPQEAILKAISEVSRTEGRVGQTTNVVIGGTVADDSTNEWLDLDQKVNTYPTVREFTAIGTGGDDFVQAMVVAVESVVQQSVPEDHVKQKLSSGGKYVSVNIGPIHVISSEQVQAVYNAMRRDERMKYFL